MRGIDVHNKVLMNLHGSSGCLEHASRDLSETVLVDEACGGAEQSRVGFQILCGRRDFGVGGWRFASGAVGFVDHDAHCPIHFPRMVASWQSAR